VLERENDEMTMIELGIVTRKETIRLGYTSYLEHTLLAPDSSFQSPFQGFVDHSERFVIIKVSTSSKLNSRLVDSFVVLVCRLENFSPRNATMCWPLRWTVALSAAISASSAGTGRLTTAAGSAAGAKKTFESLLVMDTVGCGLST
jgi:hypothetical protein